MRRQAGCAILTALVVGGFANVASGARSTPGGAIDLYVTPNNGAVYKIVIVGAIGDYGTATSINKDG